jgi:hypothetical protein
MEAGKVGAGKLVTVLRTVPFGLGRRLVANAAVDRPRVDRDWDWIIRADKGGVTRWGRESGGNA